MGYPLFQGFENIGPIRKWNLTMVIAIGATLYAQRTVGITSPWYPWLDRATILWGVGLAIGVFLQLLQNRKD